MTVQGSIKTCSFVLFARRTLECLSDIHSNPERRSFYQIRMENICKQYKFPTTQQPQFRHWRGTKTEQCMHYLHPSIEPEAPLPSHNRGSEPCVLLAIVNDASLCLICHRGSVIKLICSHPFSWLAYYLDESCDVSVKIGIGMIVILKLEGRGKVL